MAVSFTKDKIVRLERFNVDVSAEMLSEHGSNLGFFDQMV